MTPCSFVKLVNIIYVILRDAMINPHPYSCQCHNLLLRPFVVYLDPITSACLSDIYSLQFFSSEYTGMTVITPLNKTI